MNDMFQQLSDFGLIPVVAINDADHAVPLAKALVAGGLPVAEITFRTAAAEESMKRIAAEVPEVLLGAGTVLTVEQAEVAVNAGAKYIVAPGFNAKIVAYCVDNRIPVTPGVCTPTDLSAALDFGLEVVKFFPAENAGGLSTLKAISAPYGMVKFIPTGGINAGNLNTYLSFPKVLACGGSWMVKSDLISGEQFDTIADLTREAVNTMLGFDLAHVGLNAPDADTSLAITNELAGLLNLPVKQGNSSNFAGSLAEVMKSPYLGTHGHLAIATNSVPRAMAYLRRGGAEFDMSTAKPEGGPIKAVYLKGEIGGFAIHLLQK